MPASRVTFEWKAGSIFAIPLNCWYQHFNGSGQEVVRLVAVTNFPSVMNLYEDVDFVFNFDYDFKNRFSGEPDYFASKGEQDGFLLRTNFVADAINLPLITAKERGAGGGHIRFNMAKGSIASHISQFPVGTYKKAHAHGPGAHVIVLTGEGYSLMWPEGEEPRRYDWKYGTLIVPPNAWFHQHFNGGATPARYLAFKHASPRNSQGVPLSWISRRLGGNQIDYADESQVVRKLFADELAKHGVTSKMEPVYEAEAAEPAAEGRGLMTRRARRDERGAPAGSDRDCSRTPAGGGCRAGHLHLCRRRPQPAHPRRREERGHGHALLVGERRRHEPADCRLREEVRHQGASSGAASSEDVARRAINEQRAGRYEADVVETAGPDMEVMTREKALQPFVTPVSAELIPAATYAHRQWIATRINLFAGAYNTKLIAAADAPKRYEDLADPRWKGKLAVEASDANWLMQLAAIMGEDKAIKLFRDIVAANGMSVRQGHSLLANLVPTGEVPLALTVYGYRVEQLKTGRRAGRDPLSAAGDRAADRHRHRAPRAASACRRAAGGLLPDRRTAHSGGSLQLPVNPKITPVPEASRSSTWRNSWTRASAGPSSMRRSSPANDG